MSENVKHTAGQYLTFTLAGEVFALDITAVKEVLELTAITRIPRMPDYLRGVINLRGQGVPVIDLRRKFGLECAKDSVNTCIIIVEVDGPEGRFNMGALADSVREVLEIGADEIMPAPKMDSAVKMDCIEGIGQQGDSFTIILKAERIFSGEELEQVQVPTPSVAEKIVIEPAVRVRQVQP
ncbi:chemotaxis signal transduction protein [Desulfocurvibacter africanus PCS]|uniref:Chemotaxis signal transduction protein n=1 Tax=Desulfocurvibacter africanus PCS TaxID=1262666 RepID=M5PP71_DESAF|nr:chemotaxis protein CheW [Desulfocurvibacter africanus]EMG35764.1 chemotaxis signal transduction protein [Desulfocurvibacter africanus PCS]